MGEEMGEEMSRESCDCERCQLVEHRFQFMKLK